MKSTTSIRDIVKTAFRKLIMVGAVLFVSTKIHAPAKEAMFELALALANAMESDQGAQNFKFEFLRTFLSKGLFLSFVVANVGFAVYLFWEEIKMIVIYDARRNLILDMERRRRKWLKKRGKLSTKSAEDAKGETRRTR